MKKTDARTWLEITVDCPYCDEMIDVTEELKEKLDDDLRADNIDSEVKCSECKKVFIIENINF